MAFASWFTRRAAVGPHSRALSELRALSEAEFVARLVAALRQAHYGIEERADPGEPYDLVLRRRGERTLLQYRHWRAAWVPGRAVRALHAFAQAEGAAGSTVVTCGGFDARTRAFAVARSVRLLDGPGLIESMPGILSEIRAGPASTEPRTSYQPEAWSDEDIALAADPPVLDAAPAPSCPRCGSAMMLKFADGGGADGQRYWSCTRVGLCKGTRPA